VADGDDVVVPLDSARAPNAVSDSLSRIVARPLGTSRVAMARPLPGPGMLGLPAAMGSGSTQCWGRFEPQTPSTPHTPDGSAPPSGPLAGMLVAAPTPKPQSIEEIIRRANEAQAQRVRQKEEQDRSERERARELEREGRKQRKRAAANGTRGGERDKRRKPSATTGSSSSRAPSSSALAVDADVPMEKRLKKLVGEVVVRCMSRHQDELDRDTFKRHAREVRPALRPCRCPADHPLHS
jgi:hypothetical protein